MVLECGQRIGRYRLVERIGAGRESEVWRATDDPARRDVAIKVYAQCVDRVSVRLEHPNLLPSLVDGEHEARSYAVMPYIASGSLRAHLDGRAWPLSRAMSILEPLAAVLDALHQQGIVHGNLKPSNVLLTTDGCPLLCDIQVRPSASPRIVTDPHDLGFSAPGYVAPEHATGGPTTPATDRYSLGVLAYVLLTGRPPFVGNSALAILLDQIVKEAPSPRTLNPRVSEPAERAVLALLAKDPARRCRSGAEFVAALREAAGACQREGFSRFLTNAATSNRPMPV